jgi:hypothetical protein
LALNKLDFSGLRMAALFCSHTKLSLFLNELTTGRQRCFYLAIKKTAKPVVPRNPARYTLSYPPAAAAARGCG